jgi:hypothetical protein
VIELAAKGSAGQWDDRQQARALALESADEPFDHGETPVLADRAETLLDAEALAPGDEHVGRELRSVVGDQVGGSAPLDATRLPEEPNHFPGGRLLLEVRDAHRSAREVIHDDGDPPAEWPPLRQGQGQPGDPESANRRHRREVHVPDVVRALGCDDSRLRGSMRRSRRLRGGPEHSPHRRRPEVEAGTGKDACDVARSHPRTQHLQAASEIADELREPVHRLGDLDERVRALVVEAVCPRGNGERGDEELPSGLRLRPASRCA